MMEFLANNWGSLLVGAILLVVVGSKIISRAKTPAAAAAATAPWKESAINNPKRKRGNA